MHPGLAEQLRPLLTDEDPVLARTAALLARHAPGLAAALIAVVQARETPTLVRAQAVRSLLDIGDEDAIEPLRRLVLDRSYDDPEDRVLGSALSGLWPEPPRRPSFLGEYRWWLTDAEAVVGPLDAAGLAIALRWVATVSPRGFAGLPAAALARAGAELADEAIRQAFRAAVGALLERRELPRVSFGEHRGAALAAVFDLAAKRTQLHHLASAGWLRADDPEWPWEAPTQDPSPVAPTHPAEGSDDGLRRALESARRGDTDAWLAIDAWFAKRSGGWLFSDVGALAEWAELRSEDRRSALEAAHLFVQTADPETDRWFGTGSQTDRELAAYRAWSLLEEGGSWLKSLEDEVWARWCPLLVDTHLFGNDRHLRLLVVARERVPSAWFEALRGATDGRLHDVAEHVWGEDVAEAVRERVTSTEPGAWRRQLISFGLTHDDAKLRVWAEANLDLPAVLGAYVESSEAAAGAEALEAVLDRPPNVARRVVEDAFASWLTPNLVTAFASPALRRFESLAATDLPADNGPSLRRGSSRRSPRTGVPRRPSRAGRAGRGAPRARRARTTDQRPELATAGHGRGGVAGRGRDRLTTDRDALQGGQRGRAPW